MIKKNIKEKILKLHDSKKLPKEDVYRYSKEKYTKEKKEKLENLVRDLRKNDLTNEEDSLLKSIHSDIYDYNGPKISLYLDTINTQTPILKDLENARYYALNDFEKYFKSKENKIDKIEILNKYKNINKQIKQTDDDLKELKKSIRDCWREIFPYGDIPKKVIELLETNIHLYSLDDDEAKENFPKVLEQINSLTIKIEIKKKFINILKSKNIETNKIKVSIKKCWLTINPENKKSKRIESMLDDIVKLYIIDEEKETDILILEKSKLVKEIFSKILTEVTILNNKLQTENMMT